MSQLVVTTLLPVDGEEKYRLFAKLIRTILDMDKMALVWYKHMDGDRIFPKLPVYLRKHHAKWKQNERTRQAVKKAASGEEVLKKINAETQRDFLGVAASDAPGFSAAEDVLSSEVVVDLTLPPLGGTGVIPTTANSSAVGNSHYP